MTVSTTANRITYTGNGSTTVFAFPYKFIATTDLVVYVGGVLQTSGFTVGAPTDSGSNVTFSAAPANGASIVIISSPSQLQSTSLPSTGPFPAKSVETMADKLTLLVQRLGDLVSRSFTLPDSDSSGASTVLPTPSANKLIGWNGTASGLQNIDTATLATIVSYGTANADKFSGTGAQTVFTLSANPGALNNLDVSISGVTQRPGIDYTWTSGTTLTFTTAPPSGTNNVLARYLQGLPQGVSDSASAAFVQSGTGAVIRTVQDELRETVKAKQFGAVADGTTDCAAAINNAITAVSALGGGDVLLPAGTVIVGSTLYVADNVRLRGAGQKVTTIKLKASANTDIIAKKVGATGNGAGIFDLLIDGNDANNTAGGIYWAGASTGRGPTLQMERVRVTACRPSVGGSGLGVSGSVVITGSTWGIVRDCDIDQNQNACGLIHRGSDWFFDGLYFGPNGATSGQQSMIIQGGAGNRFSNCYFGGNGGLEQLLLWGSSRNLFVECIWDNSWQNAIRFADNGGNPSSNNIITGGQISSAGWKANNTYDAVSLENAASGNLFLGVRWIGLQANKARYYFRELDTAGGNYVCGGMTDANYATGFDGKRSGGGSYITGVYGYENSQFSTLIAQTKIDVQGPYDGSAPSTSSVPKMRLNNGGAISLWAGTYAYSYAWLQAIQDDGSNNLKNLVLNPLGGTVQIGLGTAGNAPSIANGTANGAVATTLGSVGPTGATAGNPQGWMRLNVAGTDRFIPYW